MSNVSGSGSGSGGGGGSTTTATRKRPPPAQQRDTVKPWLEQTSKQPAPALKIADVYYVISTKWLNQWKAHVCYDETAAATSSSAGGEDQASKPPNSIDNSVLLKDPGFKSKGNEPVIKDKAVEGADFLLISQKAWAHLHKWYGGGPELAREVIGDGKEGKTLRVEVFPLALTCKNTNTEGQINPFSAIEVVVSKKATVGYLKALVCRKMELDAAHTRVWNYIKNTGKLIKEENVTLEEAKLVDGQSLLIEVRLDDGSWPRDGIKKRKSSTSGKDKLIDGRRGSLKLASTLSNMKALLGIADEYQPKKHQSGTFRTVASGGGGSGGSGGYSSSSGDIKARPGTSKGVCGLVNLGNTCFLNSAIQCLSNTTALTEFFLSDAFKADINKSNPLGMKGQLADCYGALLKRVWSGDYSAVAPRNLKRCIGKYAPQFNGFSQHDAQEFLAFLLDGLHEDLNRVLNKPYVEIKESDGRADEEVSREAWEAHLKRNRSVIVDLFQGQLKSTVMCPEAKCGKVSITFDPFMYISLPMPPESDRLIDIILFPNEPHRKPITYSIKCAKSARVQFLKEKLEEMSGVSKRKISMIDVEDHYIHGFIPDARSVATFRTNATAFAFETVGHVDPKQALRIQVLHRRVNPAFLNSPKASDPALNPRKIPRQAFGMPFVMHLSTKRTTARQLYTMVWHRLSRFMKRDITRPYGKGESFAGSNGVGSSPSSVHVEQHTGEDGPHAVAPKDSVVKSADDDKAGTNGTTSGDNERQKAEADVSDALTDTASTSSVSTKEEKQKAKEVQHDGGYTDTESASMSGESFISKEKEESRERDIVDNKSSATRSGTTSTTTGRTSTASSSSSSSSSSSFAAQSYVPFEWPPQLDFTLDWEQLPFRLSYVAQNGGSCGKCSYSSTCTGCPIKPDDEPLKFKQVNLPTIAVDWDPKLLREFLSIEKAEEIEDHESVVTNKKQIKRRLCLDDCFRLFCMNEQLGENDQWFCPNCKDFRQARKKFELWQMPQTLVIHLKRFQYTRFSRDKIITFCDFPLTGLDLSEYVQNTSQAPIYDLYAVAELTRSCRIDKQNHQGGLGGGHYTAFGLNAGDNRWYHFNDGTTTAVSEDAVRTSAAYVLFYKLREGGQSSPTPAQKGKKESGGKGKSKAKGKNEVESESEATPPPVVKGKGKEAVDKRTRTSLAKTSDEDESNVDARDAARVKASEEEDNEEQATSSDAVTFVGGKEKNASRTVSVESVAVIDVEPQDVTNEADTTVEKKKTKTKAKKGADGGVGLGSSSSSRSSSRRSSISSAGSRSRSSTSGNGVASSSSSSRSVAISSSSSSSLDSTSSSSKKAKKSKDKTTKRAKEDKVKDKKIKDKKKKKDMETSSRKEKMAV